MRTLFFVCLLSFSKISFGQNVGVGNTNPQALLSVGKSSEFRVDESGNIIRINNVPITFPSSQGSNAMVLTNDGAGGLTWKPTLPAGNIVTSNIENDPNFINAGYTMIGKSQMYSYKSYLGLNSGTWTSLSNLSNAPLPRYGQTAVWTGTEMIIWGGTNSDISYPTSSDFTSIFKYNPTTNIWTKISSFSGTPPSNTRAYHTAIWTGTEMIIWGGQYSNGVSTSTYTDGYKYNPTTNTWTNFSGAGTSPGPRSHHTAVWTGTEMLIWGGGSGIGGRYNYSTNTWTTMALGPSYVSGACSVWTGSEMILWGGSSSTRARYNPTTNTWQFPITISSGSYPDNIQGGSAVWTGTQMLFWGGYGSGGTFNPSTNACTIIGNTPGPEPTYNNSAVWTGTQMIIYGGENSPLPWVSSYSDYNFWKFQFSGLSKSYSAAAILPLYLYQK